jgi:hypothetical protein
MAPELREYFNEEHVVLTFWSCKECGLQFETEESVREEAALKHDRNGEVDLFPETFFPSPRF